MLDIVRTQREHLPLVRSLWADGAVMAFVGFPQGFAMTDTEMESWYERMERSYPQRCHYSVFEDGRFCGESFYSISPFGDAALDIKLFSFARGRGIATAALSHAIKGAFANGASKVWVDPNPQNLKAIALYERLGFERAEIPPHLAEDITDSVYMELSRERASERGII